MRWREIAGRVTGAVTAFDRWQLLQVRPFPASEDPSCEVCPSRPRVASPWPRGIPDLATSKGLWWSICGWQSWPRPGAPPGAPPGRRRHLEHTGALGNAGMNTIHGIHMLRVGRPLVGAMDEPVPRWSRGFSGGYSPILPPLSHFPPSLVLTLLRRIRVFPTLEPEPPPV